jgi:hypothetical protein
MTLPHATRALSNTDADNLTAIRDAATVLIEHEQNISPRILTDLCLIREETTAELHKRIRSARANSQAS